MSRSESTLQFLTADAVVLHLKQHLPVYPFHRNPDLPRMSVADRVGDTLLNDTVDDVLLILAELQPLPTPVKVDLGIGHPSHVRHHLTDGSVQGEPFHLIRSEFTDGAAHILHTVPAHIRQQLKLLLHLLRRHVHKRKTGIQPGDNPCQTVPKRIVNFPCKSVSLIGLCHLFRHISVFRKLLVGILQLVVEHVYLLNRTSLQVDYRKTVAHKQNNIQGNHRVPDTKQPLLARKRVVTHIVRHIIERHVNRQKLIIRQQITDNGEKQKRHLRLTVLDIGDHIGEHKEQKPVVIKIQPIDDHHTDQKLRHERNCAPLAVSHLQEMPEYKIDDKQSE